MMCLFTVFSLLGMLGRTRLTLRGMRGMRGLRGLRGLILATICNDVIMTCSLSLYKLKPAYPAAPITSIRAPYYALSAYPSQRSLRAAIGLYESIKSESKMTSLSA